MNQGAGLLLQWAAVLAFLVLPVVRAGASTDATLDEATKLAAFWGNANDAVPDGGHIIYSRYEGTWEVAGPAMVAAVERRKAAIRARPGPSGYDYSKHMAEERLGEVKTKDEVSTEAVRAQDHVEWMERGRRRSAISFMVLAGVSLVLMFFGVRIARRALRRTPSGAGADALAMSRMSIALVAVLGVVGFGWALGWAGGWAPGHLVIFVAVCLVEVFLVLRLRGAAVIVSRGELLIGGGVAVRAHDARLRQEISAQNAKLTAKQGYVASLVAAGSPPALVATAQAEVGELQAALVQIKAKFLKPGWVDATTRLANTREVAADLTRQRAPAEAFVSVKAAEAEAADRVRLIAEAAGWRTAENPAPATPSLVNAAS